MTAKISTPQYHSPSDLKRQFETAVEEIHRGEPSVQLDPQRTPIVERTRLALAGSKVATEKQAISDAAKALALLWKISPNLAR
jgi:hypothetical protein